jgi:uncharacterized iron-regulated protein
MRVLLLAVGFTLAAIMPIRAEDHATSALGADVVFLGEVHDNPQHHETQALWVDELAPSALVFEMLTDAQAAKVTPALRKDQEALAAALAWGASGWPDFSYYFAVIAAAPDAAVLGAGVPRAAARRVMQSDLATAFGPDAQAYGLTDPLPPAQQQQRETLQAVAHCDALGTEMLPLMVDIQRLRDARIAQVALSALARHGSPVVVITGNGHARKDWGAPAILSVVAPEVSVFAVGQGEPGQPPAGTFDLLTVAEAPARGDPCAAFAE